MEGALSTSRVLALGQRFEAIVDASGPADQVHAILTDYVRLAVEVERQSVFSKNEEKDDVRTEHLMLLGIDFCIGKLHTLVMERSRRRKHLEIAAAHFDAFVTKCLRMDIVHDDDEDTIMQEEDVDPNRQRHNKIERYRRERSAKERMQALRLALQDTASDVDREEEYRELFILQLQSYVRQAVDESRLIKQEIEICDHLESESKTEDGSDSQPSSTRREANANPASDPNRPGISVTRLSKGADGAIRVDRQKLKAEVLGTRLAPPTMTLAQFADEEMARAKQAQEDQAKAERPVRSYAQLVNDGDEDDDELVDQATMHDRGWDEWREHNPKGIGNKMGKRF